MSGPFATVPGARFDCQERPPRDCSDILRYVSDPDFRAQIDAEVAARRAEINRVFDEIRRADQERVWAEDAREPLTPAIDEYCCSWPAISEQNSGEK